MFRFTLPAIALSIRVARRRAARTLSEDNT
jgi:hypothetical protein